jgi:hypothetical protein
MTTPTAGNALYDAALAYIAAGWTPTPLRDKIPTQKRWTQITPSGPDCWAWWVEDNHNGIGIICGAASGNLLVIDIEKELVADRVRIAQVVRDVDPSAAQALMASFINSAATTPSGGRHLYFRVTDGTAPGNAKLAFRGTGDDAVLLVETRGEGGQVAAPPGGGRGWIGDSGGGKTTDVTTAQLDAILDAFRSLDESGIDHTPPPAPSTPYDADNPFRIPTVADAWSKALMDGAITWADILDDGWTANGYDDEGRSLWVRPDYGDKTKAAYSAKGYERWTGGGRPVLVNHSTSVPHLPAGGSQRLTPARVWAHCHFNGDDAAALAALEAAATTGEIDPRITGTIPTAVLDNAAAIAATKGTPTLPPAIPEPDTETVDWWDERPWLRHIHTFARSRMVSPYALLSVALVRVAANTWPNLTLPPIVGGRGSLNLFCALVGPSGAGKSAVCAASDELLPWADPWVHIGSGEGLLHTFVERIKVDDPTDPDSKIKVWKVRVHNPKAAAIVDEIDTLTALGARQGSTLLPTLRTMWTGSSVGFGYADPSKRLDMKAHSYRLGMVVGAQPTRCEALFDEADAGTPQRFIWAPLTDPGAPDIPPDNPGPLVQPPIFNGVDTNFVVCESLRKATIDARQAMLRTGTTGELDGHALLNRIKIAAAIALMEGRYEVTEDDWGLSGRIQTVSDMTREWVQSRIANERAKQGQQRAEAKANEAVVVDHKLSDAVVGRVARVIARAVHRAGDKGLTKNGAKQAVAKRDRDNYAAGIEFAVAAGWIAEVERPHPRRADESVINYVPGKETP